MAAEDYVKAIYQHTEWQQQPITPSELAQVLGVAPASVTQMVKKLSIDGWVDHQPYGPVVLTARGVRKAVMMVRRHRLLETWLVQEMHYAWDEVHEEAEILEHSISDRLLATMDARLGHPAVDPHGDPIPGTSGEVHYAEAVPLAAAAAGDEVEVLRISDRVPGLLRKLAEAGVRPGTTLVVISTGATEVRVSTTQDRVVLSLTAGEGQGVWTRRGCGQRHPVGS